MSYCPPSVSSLLSVQQIEILKVTFSLPLWLCWLVGTWSLCLVEQPDLAVSVRAAPSSCSLPAAHLSWPASVCAGKWEPSPLWDLLIRVLKINGLCLGEGGIVARWYIFLLIFFLPPPPTVYWLIWQNMIAWAVTAIIRPIFREVILQGRWAAVVHTQGALY